MAASSSGDGLGRWLVGGLVVGAIMLGLLVGAYEIGYHHGQHAGGSAAPPATTALPPPTTTGSGTGGGAAAHGQQLFTADGCSSCHSLDGTTGVGPTLRDLAGSPVTLSDGSTITATDAYLAKSITDPDAQIVKGFQQGVMSAAISSFGLSGKPQDVAALVAFIRHQKG